MNLSVEIHYNLNILGLAPGATSAEIRAAFRRLARTCHPDVIGGRGAFRFQQIAGAYTFLKALGPEELGCCAPRQKRAEARRPGWSNPFIRRREKREREEVEAERRRRAEAQAVRQEEERRAALRRERAERALKRGEKAVSDLIYRMENAADQEHVNFLLSRLNSSVPEVRCLALSHLGPLADRPEVLEALESLLTHWEVDDQTARLVAALPLKLESWAFLASKLEKRAAALPDVLLSLLLSLRGDAAADKKTLEAYLCAAAGSGVALILRCWPKGVSISDRTLARLLESQDEKILVPLLLLMKQHFSSPAARHRRRLEELTTHSVVGVRVWSRSLLNA